LADYIGSTTGILKYATNSPEKEFIVATEAGIITPDAKGKSG
jgi:quinolinate synthase